MASTQRVLYPRLEVNDENNQAFVVLPSRSENRGFAFNDHRFNKGDLAYFVRNKNSIKNRIVKGKECRLYLDCIDQTGLVGGLQWLK